MNEKYKTTFGPWEVTTEGDCEGRTIRHLGTFTGYVDEIALYLANKAAYSLCFRLVELPQTLYPTGNDVHVSFDIDSGTWDEAHTKPFLDELRTIFRDRPVMISDSDYYASFKITTTQPQALQESKKAAALAKLTDEEKQLLNLV